ncbi:MULTISPECIES: phosphohexomutase domain-containing protein [Citrobacter]|uniref:phosphomannomutase n=1 Tax=Citrobacter TaxID=544 RepID=UPI0028944FBF|nr:phosphomannomutase [Citrobacter freundii complex sp. 2023EL-00966]MDT3754976.1 phosphomannomutase [Citrobacter freundii complex sp. 2023EL-00966]
MKVSDTISNSGIQFGTSGARGLVIDFDIETCAAFTLSFSLLLRERYTYDYVIIGIDNRPSSFMIAQFCVAALQKIGIKHKYIGVVPTPCLALFSLNNSQPAIMVTGSHIPFDRNGLKFYTPDGEISKDDELCITNCTAEALSFDADIILPDLFPVSSAAQNYLQRYSFKSLSNILEGMRIGIYEHSSSGRDLYFKIFESLGAEVIGLERVDNFVAIDTEAVSIQDQTKAFFWSKQYKLDAIFSTDGDGDRPLIADENGKWIRGDVLGLVCSKYLNVDCVVTPINTNSSVDKCGCFKKVVKTKIGSPFVISSANDMLKLYGSVAGFEANGGYMLFSDVDFEGNSISFLPTRDSVLPALILMIMSKKKKCNISDLIQECTYSVTMSDRLQNISVKDAMHLIENIAEHASCFAKELGENQVCAINRTDGLRVCFENNHIVHFRLSGNAPELRCYVESETEDSARNLLENALAFLENKLTH